METSAGNNSSKRMFFVKPNCINRSGHFSADQWPSKNAPYPKDPAASVNKFKESADTKSSCHIVWLLN